jgi:hypothetical protein
MYSLLNYLNYTNNHFTIPTPIYQVKYAKDKSLYKFKSAKITYEHMQDIREKLLKIRLEDSGTL